ncbi:MAG: helix-turn-helix transcriptional regulator [Pseudonocardiales bacterium]
MAGVRRRALAGARKAAGYTQESLAAALHVDRSTVIRWEAGDHAPLPYLWPRLARLLGQSQEQLRELIGDDSSDHRPVPSGAGPPGTGSDNKSESAVDELSPHMIPGRPSRAALLAASQEETIAYLREQWHLLVRADNLFGPAHALRLVHEQIELIEALLRDARDDVRTPLLSLGAQYAESAAWLHEDSDDQLAPFWASRALEWAHAGGDHRLVVWALFRRSQQVACDGDAAWSIGLVQAAQRIGAPLPDQMRAALRQQEACGLALDGDEAACHRKLDEALQWAAPEPDRHGDARSGHGAFCTATYIELQRADCWLKLGCPQRAVATYETALADLPAAYNRDRGYGLAQFGSALVATNEFEHAASVTREALGIARGCGSGRTMQRIRAVGGSLRPHAKQPTVARLLDELAAVG